MMSNWPVHGQGFVRPDLVEDHPVVLGLAVQPALDLAVPDDLVTRYRELAAARLAANLYRRAATAEDARRLARRFLASRDLILRFATRPDLDIFPTTKRSGPSARSRSSSAAQGGCWRTLDGLAEFAIVQHCLSTAAKWGISKLDALACVRSTLSAPAATFSAHLTFFAQPLAEVNPELHGFDGRLYRVADRQGSPRLAGVDDAGTRRRLEVEAGRIDVLAQVCQVGNVNKLAVPGTGNMRCDC